MAIKENLALLEEIMELDEGTLAPEMTLSNIKEWDSLAALTFVMLLDEKFSKNITADEIIKLKTVEDMLKVMV